MTENFPNLEKELYIQVEETKSIPNKMDPKMPTPRHIIINMQKFKDRKYYKHQEKSSLLPTRESQKTINGFFNRNFEGQKGLVRNIQRNEK